jgi:Family of unknown function (DUF5684)
MDMLLVVVAIFLVLSTPIFVIGRRRGLQNAWAAFIPLLGIWIVLFESIGRSGWFSLLVFIPTAGPLALLIWTAVELPAHHGRSRWWTLALIVPGVNLLGYWFYAFTLPRNDLSFA